MRSISRAVAPLLALAALLPRAAAAQNDTTPGVRLRMTYEAQYSPGFVVLPFAAGDADDVRAIVRRDLELSDRFEMKDPPAGTPPAGERPDVSAWRDRGADWVLAGTTAQTGDGATLRLTLYDAVYGQVKGTGRFGVPRAAGAATGWRCTPPATRWCAGPRGSRGWPPRASPSSPRGAGRRRSTRSIPTARG